MQDWKKPDMANGRRWRTRLSGLICGLGLVSIMLFVLTNVMAAPEAPAAEAVALDAPAPKKIAAIVTTYYHNSHADVIASRLLQTDTLDDKGRTYPLKLVSLYMDQVADKDIGRKLAADHGVAIYDKIADALTLGTGKLAVDGVLLIGEHGNYTLSPSGNIEYPKRRFFEEIVKVFEDSNRVVPIFVDKHLADNWTDAKWLYDTAQRLKIPLMAGSSVPLTWRYPAADVERDAELKQVVVVSYHTLTAYGFHALEFAQALVERRRGGETGIKAVQTLTGPAVWEAGEKGVFDVKLLDEAMGRLRGPQQGKRTLKEAVPTPILSIIEYADGLRVNVLTLNGAAAEWSAAWRYKDGRSASTLFWTQEARPFMHFTYLLNGFEQMVQTNRPTWPPERTLMTSGALDALLISQTFQGGRLETPHLNFSYRSDWNWQQPPLPPPGRPIPGQ